MKVKYQEALSKSGYDYLLSYDPETKTKGSKRNRRRRITWFNPPYSANIKTNVGKEFLNLVDKSFPKTNPLHRLFTRQTLKISYKCMPNMAAEISKHNNKLLRGGGTTTPIAPCKCDACPVQGRCKETGVIYKALVTETVSGKSETYTGLTARPFKKRIDEHYRDFEIPENRIKSKLSGHIWELQDENIDYSIQWTIQDKAPPYNPTNKKCSLCLKEKHFIMYRKEHASLNKRSEVYNTCRHRTQTLLSNLKT